MLGLPFGEAALRRVKQKAYLAYANYQPRFYRGKIHFVTAEIKSFFPGDPATIWADLAAELEIEIIPGNHLNIVTTQLSLWLWYSLATSNTLLAGYVDDYLQRV